MDASSEESRLFRLAYYPFLPDVAAQVAAIGPNLDDLLVHPRYQGVRQRGLERVVGALKDGRIPTSNIADRYYQSAAIQEVSSAAIAKMLIVAMNEKKVIPRYAEAEATREAWFLAREPDPHTVLEVAGDLGCPIEQQQDASYEAGAFAPLEKRLFSVNVATYLMGANLRERKWKLIARRLARGWVTVDQDELAEICHHLFVRRIGETLERELQKPLDPRIPAALSVALETLRPILDELRESWTTGDFGPVQPGLFPPCIKEIFESLKRNENVPHHGRFAFATFLNTIGWNSEQILDYLASTPNFDRDKSRYQIEHVTGQKSVGAYTPPGCGTMQTNGVCPLDKRDGLCFKIKHPLSYYRAKIRFQQQDSERAGAAKPAQAAAPAAVNP